LKINGKETVEDDLQKTTVRKEPDSYMDRKRERGREREREREIERDISTQLLFL
jgi:hypothetical protein